MPVIPVSVESLLRMPHQPAALLFLAIGKDVFSAGEGIFPAFEDDTDGSAGEVENLAEGVFEITAVGIRHVLGLVAVDNDGRRIGAALMGVAQFDAAAADHRRCVAFDGLLEYVGQFGRWQVFRC